MYIKSINRIKSWWKVTIYFDQDKDCIWDMAECRTLKEITDYIDISMKRYKKWYSDWERGSQEELQKEINKLSLN